MRHTNTSKHILLLFNALAKKNMLLLLLMLFLLLLVLIDLSSNQLNTHLPLFYSYLPPLLSNLEITIHKSFVNVELFQKTNVKRCQTFVRLFYFYFFKSNSLLFLSYKQQIILKNGCSKKIR